MVKPISKELSDLQKQVEENARQCGLDFFQTIYELLDYDEINMVASYGGFPIRYPHWKWGMEYDKLKKSFEYGFSRIYEMVINNDPCYAYLLESNSLIDQKIVMCHVTGHNDFFKNNFAFSHTNRKMINHMANHAARVRKYIEWYGLEIVEKFIDQALSIENLIDINSPYIKRNIKDDKNDEDQKENRVKIIKLPANKEYMDRYVNPDKYIYEQKEKAKEEEKKQQIFPKTPERDVLGFLIEKAPLKRWQADILDIIRNEAYYFAPQAMTKIMNEGWATYWHAKLMTQKVMKNSEIIDFADRHASILQTQRQTLNPYKLGMELFRDIENRYNKGQFGQEWDICDEYVKKNNWDLNLGLGLEKIFQVRKIYNDQTFIDEFLTLDFCKRQGLFTYGFDKKSQEFIIESRDFTQIKNKLLNSITNFGHPQVRVINGNYENRSELLLEHMHYGIDLDLNFAKETLKNISLIWTRPVHIMTKIDDKNMVLSHDGQNYTENFT